MKSINLTLIILVVLIMASCTVVGTLYRVISNRNEYIFKNEMIGKWAESLDSSSYYFEIDTLPHEEGKIYSFRNVETNIDSTIDTTSFLGYLFKLKDWYYLDCWYRMEEEIDDYLTVRHFIFRINFIETEKIELMTLIPEEIIKLIDEKKLKLSYARFPVRSKEVEYDYLILDKPDKLKKALAASEAFPKLYEEKSIYYRLKD